MVVLMVERLDCVMVDKLVDLMENTLDDAWADLTVV